MVEVEADAASPVSGRGACALIVVGSEVGGRAVAFLHLPRIADRNRGAVQVEVLHEGVVGGIVARGLQGPGTAVEGGRVSRGLALFGSRYLEPYLCAGIGQDTHTVAGCPGELGHVALHGQLGACHGMDGRSTALVAKLPCEVVAGDIHIARVVCHGRILRLGR